MRLNMFRIMKFNSVNNCSQVTSKAKSSHHYKQQICSNLKFVFPEFIFSQKLHKSLMTSANTPLSGHSIVNCHGTTVCCVIQNHRCIKRAKHLQDTCEDLLPFHLNSYILSEISFVVKIFSPIFSK